MLHRTLLTVAFAFLSVATHAQTIVTIETPMSPPAWALLERELIRANTVACQEFFARYFDERGYLQCVERWGGDDGPDDAIENLNDWPLLHALGAPDVVRRMVDRAWEGHLRQYTEAKTTEVDFARDGMYYQEFPVMMDWLHNGEGLTVFNLTGLCNPHADRFQQRVRRFAGFYLNESPQAPNYDPQHKIIRSLFNGSRGPLLRKATALDWAGDPIEVEHRFRLGHGERTYIEMLKHFEEYNDIIGDHPQNLLATSLAFNAFALSGESKYKQWLLEYVDAWVQRAAANGGIIPSNIGLDGKIGGATDGKWYGGVYGWAFTVTNPVDGKKVSRSCVRLGVTGFGNALLLTGHQKYVDVWRTQLDKVNANSRMIDGRKQYPHMFGDQGWYDFTPEPYNHGALEVWYWSQRDDDRQRVAGNSWVRFLVGSSRDYPEQALRRDLNRVRDRVAAFRQDTTTPDTRLADDPLKFNPCSVESLLQLTQGAIHPGKVGSPLHARLRYFDPLAQRPGLPADVAALVDRLTTDEVGVTLVNVHQTEPRTVVVQAGAYGEHQFTSLVHQDREQIVAGRAVTVRLAPGGGDRIVFRTARYAQPPTFDWPIVSAR